MTKTLNYLERHGPVQYSGRAWREVQEIGVSPEFIGVMVSDAEHPQRHEETRSDGTLSIGLLDIHIDLSEDRHTVISVKNDASFRIYNCRSQWAMYERLDQSLLRDLFIGLVVEIPGKTLWDRRNTCQRIRNHASTGGFLPPFKIRSRSTVQKDFHYFELKEKGLVAARPPAVGLVP